MWTIVIAVALAVVSLVVWLATREDRREADFGSVSHQWIAEHRAQAQESRR